MRGSETARGKRCANWKSSGSRGTIGASQVPEHDRNNAEHDHGVEGEDQQQGAIAHGPANLTTLRARTLRNINRPFSKGATGSAADGRHSRFGEEPGHRNVT